MLFTRLRMLYYGLIMILLPFMAHARGGDLGGLVFILVVIGFVAVIGGLNNLTTLFWAYIALSFIFTVNLLISMLLVNLNLIEESDLMISALIGTALIVGYLLYVNRTKPSNEP